MSDPCGICGWPPDPGAGACPACGATRGEGAPRRDDPRLRLHLGARPEDFPELEHAFRAWAARDAHQMVAACLPSLRVSGARHVDHGGLRYWPLPTSTSVVFVVHDADREELGVEAPVLRLPDRLSVPLMRFLLDTNGLPEGGHARYCLRDDVVVLRWARRFASCSPPELVTAIREVARRIDRAAAPLAAAFFAKPLATEIATRGHDPALLGTPRALRVLEPQAAPSVATFRSPPRAAPAPPSAAGPVGARASIRDEARERLAAAERFSALMDETVHRSRLDDEPLSVLVQRAALFRAAHEFGDRLPDAVAVLFAAGRALVDHPPRLAPKRGIFRLGGPSADIPSARILPPVFARLGRDLGDVDRAPPDATPRPFASTGELKAHLRDLLEDLEAGSIQPEIKAFVLLGAVAEALLRAPIPRERLAALETAYDEAVEEPPIRAVARLRHLLGRLAQ